MSSTSTSSQPAQQDLSLLEQPVAKLFWRYSIPTIASMLITGIYVAIDGMFVGHYLGETGLAGMMLAYPVGAILYAVGALIGMGSAALVSMNLGQGNIIKARHILSNAFSLCLLAGLFFAVCGSLFAEDILIALGAEGEVLHSAHDYLFWYFALSHFPIMSLAFTALLRNDGRPHFVTCVLITGGILNTFLDWLFIVVYPFGLAGAAIATMLSQAVTGLLCLQHFFGHKTQLKINWSQMRLRAEHCIDITKTGFPSFLMNLYLSIVLTLHNTALLWVGAPLHVAVYGVISYTEAIFYLVFEGIAFGTQPIFSFNAGAGRYDRVKEARHIAFSMTLLVAVIGLILIYTRPQWMVYLFAGNNPELTPVAIEGLRWYFWGLPMEGLLLVGASFFQAIGATKESAILTGLKLILIAAVIYLFAWAFGVFGVWISLASCSAVLTIWMLFAIKRVDKYRMGA
ncbi:MULTISPECIES: MATE family efflux transporter [Shewanella]|uniref:Multidrug export protein MepA n=1 Tax=Shewanella holmiensis TaxID=2952222 RepID=A0A9X2WNA6_9GAMM|nr:MULTISPECIES: MATE family efflux transporter [Shewanella]MCT7942310.1 MATE family efflux transporter [Shewanella holmiensis]MDP5146911.1 MATE family efflux transporter [Shewanella sp. ULN5]